MKNPDPRSMAPDGRAYIPRSLTDADDDDDARCFNDDMSSSLLFVDALHVVTNEWLSDRLDFDCIRIRRDGSLLRANGKWSLARAAAGDDDGDE